MEWEAEELELRDGLQVLDSSGSSCVELQLRRQCSPNSWLWLILKVMQLSCLVFPDLYFFIVVSQHWEICIYYVNIWGESDICEHFTPPVICLSYSGWVLASFVFPGKLLLNQHLHIRVLEWWNDVFSTSCQQLETWSGKVSVEELFLCIL